MGYPSQPPNTALRDGYSYVPLDSTNVFIRQPGRGGQLSSMLQTA